MAENNYGFLLSAQIDDLSVSKIKSQIQDIGKSVKLNLDVNINSTNVSKVKQELQDINNVAKNFKPFNMSHLGTDLAKNAAEMYKKTLPQNELARLKEEMSRVNAEAKNKAFDEWFIPQLNKTSRSAKDAANAFDELYKSQHKVIVKTNDSSKYSKIDPTTFEQIKLREKEIQSSVDALSKLTIKSNPDEITQAVFKYTDAMGRAVTETMGWRDVQTEANETLRVFSTLSKVSVDDIGKRTNMLEKEASAQEDLNRFRESALKTIESMRTRNSKAFAENPEIAKKAEDLTVAVPTVGEKGGLSIKQMRHELQLLNKDVGDFNAQVKNVNRDGYAFTEMLTIAAKKIAIWALGTKLIYGTLKKIKDGIAYINELDNSLNQIRIVTGQSAESVRGLAKEYNELAKSLKVTTAELTSVSVELYRQGLSGKEIEDRMMAITKYAKISNISLEESEKIITATANATGESVQKIIDIFAHLGRIIAPAHCEVCMKIWLYR